MDEVLRFYKECFVKCMADESNASQLAEVLRTADYVGAYNYGINRLGMYLTDLDSKIVDGYAKPMVIKENRNTAWVNGNNSLGPVVANFCMDLAIKKATDSSIGWVVARCSNDYGMSSAYTMRALQKGLLALCFSNSSPTVIPAGSKKAALGTNPLSAGAPAKGCDSFLLDMSTSNASMGKIEVCVKTGDEIPEGWALDGTGNSTTDPVAAFRANSLLPLAAPDNGHKGYALGMMVEILTSMLAAIPPNTPSEITVALYRRQLWTYNLTVHNCSNNDMCYAWHERKRDSAWGPNVRKWMTTDKVANLGQTFVCINPECFAPCFQERVGCLLDCLRKIEPADPNNPVLVPGDLQRAHMKEVDESNMIKYNKAHIINMKCIAGKMDIEPMKTHKPGALPPPQPPPPASPPAPPASQPKSSGQPEPSCKK